MFINLKDDPHQMKTEACSDQKHESKRDNKGGLIHSTFASIPHPVPTH